jgi:hypothetical protein
MPKLAYYTLTLLPMMLFSAPNNPSNLTFSDVTQTSVTLHWQDNANHETAFKIYRDGSLIAILNPNSRTFTDSGLEKSTSYNYKVKASDDTKLKSVLFAHGYKSNKETWDLFATYAQNSGYNVFRFDVPEDASIKDRATVLANKIVQNSDKIADNSLLAVGHSMGGLDLRYIVSLGHKNQNDKDDLFYKAAKKIEKIYTLASPHKGTGLVGIDDATKDMEDENMKIFNETYPYSTYSIDGRKIGFVAYRFKCGDAKVSDGDNPPTADSDDTDGVVFTKKQIFNGASHIQSILSGKHTDSALCLVDSDIELSQTDVLEDILNNQPESLDVKDIVFYEENGCKGDEAGIFSSSYKAGGVRCLDDSACSDNKISSMMLYPNIKKDTTIELYSNKSDSTTDDWAVLTIGNTTLSKPICINSFETSLSQEVKDLDISMEYHEVSLGENGLDGKVSYIKVH